MCGIAGWVGSRSSTSAVFDEKLQSIKKVIEFQNHRGPDANGIWEDRVNDVILGHNRLSIVELSEAGAQPMADDSGIGLYRTMVSSIIMMYSGKN